MKLTTRLCFPTITVDDGHSNHEEDDDDDSGFTALGFY